ncbi:MAG: hypothetical protein Q9219_000496 [cf. Caloplaca sp. 3 TL-2023]
MLLLTFFFYFRLLRPSFAAYSLQDDYSGSNFLSGFTFFTDTDPTAGYVDYVDGQSSGLFSQSGGSVKLSVDSSDVASGRGRKSVRLTSKASYNHALIVIDIGHMPANICGVWPALYAPPFFLISTKLAAPSSTKLTFCGEIDIVEGVSKQSTNKMTLHSDPGCSMNGKDCQGSTGCSIDAGPYGAKINSAGGTVYAMEWTSDGMSIWAWSGGSAPSDATGKAPDPSGWGDPLANFPSGSSCEVDSFFKDQQIVFDTTFCGVWAGDVWPSDPDCSSLAPTCEEYVQNNPSAFRDAYWTINSLKVYTNGDGSSSSGSSNTGTGGGNNNNNNGNDNPASSVPANPVPSATDLVSARPPAAVATTTPAAVQSGGSPVSTGRPPGGRWGGGGGRGAGGRGSPPAVVKKKGKRSIRGRHVRHLVLERSEWFGDEGEEQGQTVLKEGGVPRELGG